MFFGVAMTMVTIVRQSSGNVAAEDRGGGGGGFERGQEEVWSYSSSISGQRR